MDKQTQEKQAISMLQYLPARPDYEMWIKVISSLVNTFNSDVALRILLSHWQDEKEGETAEKTKYPMKGIGFGTLVYYAKQYGYNTKETITSDYKPSKSHKSMLTKQKYVDPDLFMSLPDFENSFFAKYYNSLFGERFNWHCWDKYHLKSDQHGNLVIPFYNYNGRNCKIKVIPYTDNGRRLKDTKYPAWHSVKIGEEKYKFTNNNGYYAPLYNEMALNPKYTFLHNYTSDTAVFVVESEKSVIIASYFFPDIAWVASCGNNGLTDSKVAILRGRTVKIVYDNKTEDQEKASRDANRLKKLGIGATPYDMFGKYNVKIGFDIADAIELLYRNGDLQGGADAGTNI